jgi:hypothetical protein
MLLHLRVGIMLQTHALGFAGVADHSCHPEETSINPLESRKRRPETTRMYLAKDYRNC